MRGRHSKRAGTEGRAAAAAPGAASGERSQDAAVPDDSRGRAGSVVSTIVAIVLFLAGAALLLYPTVSNYFAERVQLTAIQTYESAVEEASEEDLSAEWLAAQVYNENLAGDPVHDPFVVGSGYALPENYEDVLNIAGDGVMGYLEIPCIDVLLPIYHGTSDEVLEEGVGHIDYTSLPIGGESTHSVLCAHRGLPSAELFTYLDKVEIGDEFYIHVLDDVLAYEVDQILVVEPDELDQLQIEDGKDYVTLLTCTPYGVNTQRLLVRGHRVDYVQDDDEDAVSELARSLALKLAIAVLVVALLVIAIVLALMRRRAKRRQREHDEASGEADELAADDMLEGPAP